MPEPDRSGEWLVTDLWFLLGDSGPAVRPSLLQSNLEQSEAPELVSFSDVRDLADNAAQVINGTFLARVEPGAELASDLRESASTIVQVIDSSFWQFWSRDRAAMSAALSVCDGAVLKAVAAIERVV